MLLRFSRLNCVPGLFAGLVLATSATCAHAQEQAVAPPQMIAPPQGFMIQAIDVVGVTKLPARDIERIIYPFMGPNKSPADVEAARKAIQDAYAKAGYEATVVEVPPQPQEEFAQGLIQIRVAEAPVGAIRVTDAKHHSAELVQRQLPSLKPGEPINFKALQAELAAANRFPDREVVPSFDAGAQPGTIDVNLKVRDSHPLHASATLDNDHSPNTTPLRVNANIRHTNIWGVGHSLTVGGVIAPQNPSDTEAVFAAYNAPLLGSPWTIVVSGYWSNSNIASLGGTNVLGNGFQVGAQAIYRLAAKRDYHAFRVGVDYKDFKQTIGLAGATISQAPIRYIPMTLGYNFSMAREKSSLDLGVSGTFGLRVIKRLGCFDPNAAVCTPEDQFTNRELDSSENFTHINLDASYTRVLGKDWVAFWRLSGQYADSHLVSNEQFSIGGLSSVRGYLQSEAVGDKGIGGTFELRSPSFATKIGTFVDELRLFAFLDGGVAALINPGRDVRSSASIASVGAGMRLKLFGLFSGEVLGGVPLISTNDTAKGEPRLTFSVKGEF